ncbi:SMP-30/gluconolactonase/LRE family protein [Propionimicrobium sp. PCR01-08-3]|uniref:SMP-30/gluconolactonase/LRE family protein n=1 Tax=Propionimicrobium sp. PCR01-08-3 TaxID=3052086 RepID=UPI00255CCD72|nr:SMP-30/gluconolactonase/LRE family protein [Propionimicrobium sp. PCR01-08-3]WIY83920.1 SMP-30/gluconolactonase/LRE family protein [Propionimicrobium sp. PCR01-08-3]
MSFVDDTGLLLGNELELLGDGSIRAQWAEGPVWLPDQKALRFSDIPGNRILQWSSVTGLVSVFRDEVEFTNGRTTGLDGEVIQCSHGNRWVEVERDGEAAPLVTDWHGHKFNSPNDVIVKSDGTIWFSDPSYGIFRGREGHPGELEYRDHWVFRLDPVTCHCEPVIMDVEMPNGLAFSPDESLLYSSDNSIDQPDETPNPDGTHAIRVYKVIDGRLCKGGRDFVTITDGIADGIRVDELGNVWSAEFSGVHIYNPDGEQIGFIPSAEQHVGNLCFGGEDGTDLFILCSTQAYRVRTKVRDAAQVLRAKRG